MEELGHFSVEKMVASCCFCYCCFALVLGLHHTWTVLGLNSSSVIRGHSWWDLGELCGTRD